MNVFEIQKEYTNLAKMSEAINEETGEFIYSDKQIKEELDKLNDTRDKKLESIEYVKRELKAKSELLNDEINRLKERKRSFEKNYDRLRNLQDMLLQGEKLKTDKFTFSYRKIKTLNTTNADIEKLEKLGFVRVKKEIDKAKLKKADNLEELGVKVVEKESLSVR